MAFNLTDFVTSIAKGAGIAGLGKLYKGAPEVGASIGPESGLTGTINNVQYNPSKNQTNQTPAINGVTTVPMVLGTSTSNSNPQNSVPAQSSQPSGPSQEEVLRSEVSKLFDPVFAALSNQESTANTNYGITTNDINQQYQTSADALNTQKEQGLTELTKTGEQAGRTKEDALTASTRLYNELVGGGRQRFGGASSASDAFNTLTAVEEQRKRGTIQQAYSDAMSKVSEFKNNLIVKFQDATKELESQKLSALANARQQFNDAILAISNAKNQAQTDKATASLNAINDLRNKVYKINQEALNFAQTLAANKDASLAQVDAYTKKVIDSITGGQNTYENLNTLSQNTANSTNYGRVNANVTPTSTYTGVTSPTRKSEDFYSGLLA